ncbi:MAG TPA: hypothetical protein VFV19_06880 [Candidatus Polarisedimenticolaceae bacterium]|nr:hypothetical protein [Candidatus Polarisedimenticolaceae bacterium]
MARFLIEVPHKATLKDCVHAIEVFHRTGSHFLTHADWGCKDGEHSAWMTVEVKDKDEAMLIVPTPFRAEARIIKLNAFTEADLVEIKRVHEV